MSERIEASLFREPTSIGDYAIIGDCRSAALVSRGGSIDWLCWPHFHSSSVFAALLDEMTGGRFSIHPTADTECTRRYVPDTNVLETRHQTDSGVLVATDCMAVATEEEKNRRLIAAHEILRFVECTEGAVEVEVFFEPRFDYGRTSRRMQQRRPDLIVCQRTGSLLALQSSVPLEVDDHHARALIRLTAGQRLVFSLTYCEGEPASIAGLGELADERLRQTIDWWQRWVGHCDYQGEYREPLVRSLLALKLLTFAPSGAVVAAPTTSLPESIGGERNWDYRFCWIRDASLIVEVLLDAGYSKEAAAYLGWLLHTTRRTAPEVGILYDVFGRPVTVERTIPWLSGFHESRPVRIGNAAAGQLQLDCYGEVIEAAADFAARGGELEPASQRLLVGFGEQVCRRWREPDEGIWEPRNGRSHHTHSKLMCWVALNRLLQLHHDGVLEVPVEMFERERDAILQAIEERAYDPQRNTYVARFGTNDLDAALLLLPHHGLVDYNHERAVGTRECIERELCKGPLVARYRRPDGVLGEEGAFGACCFWLVSALAEQGEIERARQHLDELLSYGNDVGLFAEEFAWQDGSPLGNFPQGFTHVGAIKAILTIARACGQTLASDDAAGKAA